MTIKPGIYNIYKPAGPTSHDIVVRIRKIISDDPSSHKATKGKERVGHAGTLDPFAEGVLIVAIGREYTKKLGQFLKQDKTYKATIKLGAVADTYDLTGKITPIQAPALDMDKLSKKEMVAVLKNFVGEIEQIPPPFSAIKIHPVKSALGGAAEQQFNRVKSVRAYKLARRGIFPDLKPRKIKIYKIKILKYKWPYLEIETKVSSGTYIRSLAYDLGQFLKTGAYLEKLVRTRIGRYNLTNSLKLDSLSSAI